MKSVTSMVAIAAVLCLAPAAQAKIITVHVDGVVTSQLNPGTDPIIQIGDKITFDASFDDSLSVVWGSNGYSEVGLYTLPISGLQFAKVTLDGFTWAMGDANNGGVDPFFQDFITGRSLFDPGIVFNNSHVLGLFNSSQMSPTPHYSCAPSGCTPLPFVPAPALFMGSSSGTGIVDDGFSSFTPAPLSDIFFLLDPQDAYDDHYPTPGFQGRWDFANATITGVPEPSSWLMMMLGAMFIGGAARRLRSKTRLEPAGS